MRDRKVEIVDSLEREQFPCHMQQRALGNTQLQLTTIGIGTWAIGGGDWAFGWGDQDEKEAVAGIQKGVDLGVNWIDTAAIYGDGASEVLVRKALQDIPRSERPLVATKCGRVMQEDGTVMGSLKKESVIRECEASLQRLGVECIDLYQIHWPDPDEDIEEAWHAMVQMKEEGKIREIGVSNHSVQQLERLQSIHPVASLQPPYSMLNRELEEDRLPYCGENGVGVVCYSPMMKGLLTGAFTRERAEALSDKDHRSRDPKFTAPQLELNLEVVEAIRPIAEEAGRPMAQLPLAWVLRRSEVTSAIVGVRKPSQIEQTVGGGDWILTPEELDVIEGALEVRAERLAQLGEASQGWV
ncbi:MAG: aldo/keto reductase [Roseibacillus sp.]|nr:aldo/keto reductase [Roseibacillus sp.]